MTPEQFTQYDAYYEIREHQQNDRYIYEEFYTTFSQAFIHPDEAKAFLLKLLNAKESDISIVKEVAFVPLFTVNDGRVFSIVGDYIPREANIH